MEYLTLNNGIKMPKLGYGVFQIADLEECEKCVLEAIQAGYRLIDTAQSYANEEAVGNAIRKSGVPRDEIFITTKVWIANAGYENAKASIERSLKRLQVDYIDLMLIHQPYNDYYGTYHAMEELYKEGKLKAIGISNFFPDKFIDLSSYVEIKPAINQLGLHVFNQRPKAREIMKKYGIQPEASTPLAQAKDGFLTNETLIDISKKHNKTVAQVALRFLVQNDIIAIPKTVSKERMEENINIFDFELSQEDMKKIEALDTQEEFMYAQNEPERVEWMIDYKKDMRY